MGNMFIEEVFVRDKRRRKNRQGEHLEYNAGMTPVKGEGKEGGLNRKSLKQQDSTKSFRPIGVLPKVAVVIVSQL